MVLLDFTQTGLHSHRYKATIYNIVTVWWICLSSYTDLQCDLVTSNDRYEKQQMRATTRKRKDTTLYLLLVIGKRLPLLSNELHYVLYIALGILLDYFLTVFFYEADERSGWPGGN